jgi:hypothetical protein
MTPRLFYIQAVIDHWKFCTPENYEASEVKNLLHAPKPRNFAPLVCSGNDARAFLTPTYGLLFFPSPPPAETTLRVAQHRVDSSLPIEGVSLLNVNVIADHIYKLSQDVSKLTECDLIFWSPSAVDPTYKATHINAA